MSVKPSKMFVKHGFLKPGEFDATIHYPLAENMDERNINPENLDEKYYTEEEMEQMRNEIKQAVCPICNKVIDNNERCRICQNGHKFHSTCYGNNDRNTCPTSENRIIRTCKGNYKDFYSGGKKSKRRKTRKTRKTRRNRRNRRHRRK